MTSSYIVIGSGLDGNSPKTLTAASEASTSLNNYLRNCLQLHGTKAMCHEGGCGACIVSVSTLHSVSRERQTFAVNSVIIYNNSPSRSHKSCSYELVGFALVSEFSDHLKGTEMTCDYCKTKPKFFLVK